MDKERVLAASERKILRKIYGPVKENELWRIRRNDELEV
jgi:ribosomal protein S28E/S33